MFGIHLPFRGPRRAHGAALCGWVVGGLALLPGVTAQDAGTLDERIDRALVAARPVLLQQLENAGSEDFRALACLAALHDGVPPTDPTLAAALDRVLRARLDRTYGLAVRLMVLQELPDLANRERAAARDLRALLRNQGDGGFAYGGDANGSSSDLSNTQYAALGMRSAAAVGVQVPPLAWARLARAALRAQGDDGSFGYTPDVPGYPSMTVAGITVLELCAQYVRGERAPVRALGAAAGRAWDWMRDHSAAVGDVAERWTYYFHYGLERAAVLSGRDLVGDVDWYEAGARMLLAEQLETGGWSGVAAMRIAGSDRRVPDAASTAFAVLFLRRKFQRIAGPVTGSSLTLLDLPERATARQVEQAAENAVRRGSAAAMPDVLRAMRSGFVVRRRAAALALARLAERDFGFDPEAEPSLDDDSVEDAERWWLTEGRRRGR